MPHRYLQGIRIRNCGKRASKGLSGFGLASVSTRTGDARQGKFPGTEIVTCMESVGFAEVAI